VNRVKSFDATGVAPSGRLYAGDVNAIQDAAAAQMDLAQILGAGTIEVGESGLQIVRFAALDLRITGAVRTDGILRGLGGLYAGQFTTAQRDAIDVGLAPFGLVVYNTTTNQLEINKGTDGARNWQPVGSRTDVGTYAARPAANTVAAGVKYFATDTLGMWQSDGAAWTLISQEAPLIAPAALSTLPGPYDGQLVSLQVDATNSVNWTFRYNAGSASAFKWEAIGPNPALTSEVATQETTASATYAALTTAGPSVTIPRNGDYDVQHGAMGTILTAGGYGAMSYDIGGTGAVDADAMNCAQNTSPGTSHSRRKRKTGLTAGQALVSKYRGSAANTTTFSQRWMAITPVRIS
jgi:hypothetical protein